MASIASISAALKKTEVKKSSLREAFDNLKGLSSSLSSFTLRWEDIEEHFSSIQAQLERRCKDLESHVEKSKNRPSVRDPLSKSAPPAADPSETASVQPRPELKAFCTGMDGAGLIKYINGKSKERQAIRKELPGALISSPDPASLVLDAVGGFYRSNPKGEKDQETLAIRRNCVMLLEELPGINREISPETKERAKTIAMEWKGEVSTNGENPLEALSFLHLLASYGLSDCFDSAIIIEFFVIASRYHQALRLSHNLLSAEEVPDLIQKLIDGDKKALAVKFIFEHGLTEKFPPVQLLKDIVTQSKKTAKKVRVDGNQSLQSLNEAAAKEISALRQVIKFIEDHNLGSEYPKVNLEKRVEQLENEKKERKRPAVAAATKQQQQQVKSQKQKGSKRARVGPALGGKNAATGRFSLPALPHCHPHPARLLPDRSYLASADGPYGYAGPTAAKYPSTTPGHYGLSGTAAGYGSKLSPTRPLFHSSGLHSVPSAYYDRAPPPTYGYQSAYYP